MKADEVNPNKWQWDANYPIRVLYDDDEYSVIWGKYEKKKSLGVRWNSGLNDNIGFPKQGKSPTWFIEPDFIAVSILHRLLTKVIDSNENEAYLENIIFAINELNNNLTGE